MLVVMKVPSDGWVTGDGFRHERNSKYGLTVYDSLTTGWFLYLAVGGVDERSSEECMGRVVR